MSEGSCSRSVSARVWWSVAQCLSTCRLNNHETELIATQQLCPGATQMKESTATG